MAKHVLHPMELNIRLLRIAGGWPRLDRLHDKSERLYLCYSTAILFLFFIYVLIQVYGLLVYYHSWHTLDAAIEDFIVVMTGLIAFIKMALYIWNQRALQRLIDYMNNDLVQQYITDESDQQVMQACVRHERRLTKTYLSFAYCISCLYLASSASRIMKQRHMPTKKTPWPDTLPLKNPFYLEESSWYSIAYVHQLVIMFVNGQVGVVTDSFFSSLLFYICGHLRVVRNKMAAGEAPISRRLVNHHIEVLKCLDRIQATFNTFLTLQLSLTAFLLCLAVFQITQIEDIKPIIYIKCLIYLTIKVWQLLMYCWYGQEISHRSAEISQAVFMSPWYISLGHTSLKNFYIVMMRAQKPVVLSAGIFFTLSLRTFRVVINTAYTCFTLINIIRSG